MTMLPIAPCCALLAVAAVIATATSVSAMPPPATLSSLSASSAWDWSRTHTWAEFGSYANLTAEQAEFVATHYDIVGFGGNFGHAHAGEIGQAEAVRQLKSYRNSTKVLLYRNSIVSITGDLAADAIFQAHPEWWLRDQSGKVMYDGTFKYIDWTVPAASNWFVSTAVNAIKNVSNNLADGIWLDGGVGEANLISQLGVERNAAFNAAHRAGCKALTAAVHELGPGKLVLGNGLSLYRYNPGGAVSDLANVDGGCTEHFGAFETLDPATGQFNGTAMEVWLEVIAASAATPGKAVIVKGWPGPVTVPLMPTGPSWRNKTNWTYNERQAAATSALDFTLGAYLLAVAPNVYLSYSWWYRIVDGYVPCPAGSNVCSCPADWYPQLNMATGAPLGPRQHVPGAGSGHVWTRSFEHVTVTIDLAVFGNVTIDWKQSNAPTTA
eukprot:m.63078 g.63078  ORF g.63078 m.63078 type:complete len:438 (-) comp13419_c0_seq2:17-1330(-)